MHGCNRGLEPGGRIELGRLLLLFILVPLTELVILVHLGDVIGLLPTIAITVGSGSPARRSRKSQGLRALVGIRQALALAGCQSAT